MIWLVCGNLKELSALLGQHSGNTKYPCFLYLWNSRAKYWSLDHRIFDYRINRKWRSGEMFVLGTQKHVPLVNKQKSAFTSTAHKIKVNEAFRQSFRQIGKVFRIPLLQVFEACI